MAPEIVVNCVGACDFTVPLTAEVCALMDDSSRRCNNERCRAGNESNKDLHIDWIIESRRDYL